MKKIKVNLDKKVSASYEICVGYDILDRIGLIVAKNLPALHYVIVTDSNVSGLYGERLLERLKEMELKADIIEFPAGEDSKNIVTTIVLVEKLLKLGADRSSALLALGGGVLTITRRNAVHSAIWLIVSLLGVAGLFLLQQAEFLAGVQVILYVGGIMVLFLFVIMLVNLDQAARERRFSGLKWVALACVGALVFEVMWFARQGAGRFLLGPPSPAPAESLGNSERVARVLFSEYLLPFELASILLLVAIIGAVVMAKKRI